MPGWLTLGFAMHLVADYFSDRLMQSAVCVCVCVCVCACVWTITLEQNDLLLTSMFGLVIHINRI